MLQCEGKEKASAPLRLQVTPKVLWDQNFLKAYLTPDRVLPSNMHPCLLLRQERALPLGGMLPFNPASLQESGKSGTSVEFRISLLAALTIAMLIQSWAELIIQKSHKWISLVLSSMRLGWCSDRGRNFAIWLERSKSGSSILHFPEMCDLHMILYGTAGWRVSMRRKRIWWEMEYDCRI